MLLVNLLVFLNIWPSFATRIVDPLDRLTVWQRLLQTISNGTGEVIPDPTLEFLIRQGFQDLIKPRINQGQDILGVPLDPYALFPIGPVKWKKRMSRGEVTACHLHLHNLKASTLDHVEVQRDTNLTNKAIKVLLKVPIVWMTGNYQVKKGLFFGVLPTKTRGSFNIDLKDLTVGFLVSLITTRDSISIDQFEVGLHWHDADMKFDTSSRGINKISDLFLSKVNSQKKKNNNNWLKFLIRKL